MAKKIVRSCRGEPIDFDLLSIKQELSMAPTTVSINDRKTFVDNRDKKKGPEQVEEKAVRKETHTPTMSVIVGEDEENF